MIDILRRKEREGGGVGRVGREHLNSVDFKN